MMDEQQYHADDLVGAYVLGAVTPEEAASVEAHLATCEQCRRLERELRDAEEALPLLAGTMEPSARLKDRLLAAVAAEPRGSAGTPAVPPDEREEASRPVEREPIPLRPAAPVARMDRGMRRYLPLIALAAAVIIVAVGVWRIVGPGPAPRPTIQVAMVPVKGQPPIKGQFSYYKDGQRVVLDLSRVKTLPPGRVYELWLVRTNHAGTITGVTGVTTFRPKANGTARVEVTGHKATGYQLAALTVEKGFAATPTPPIKATARLFGTA